MINTNKPAVTLDKQDFGKKIAIISQSGYGKSYTARILIEDARALGIPTIIIDPQRAHLNHKTIDYIHALQVKDAKAYGILVAQSGASVCLQTKGMTITAQNEFVNEFITGYRSALRTGIQLLVIDEIHKFAPEHEKTQAKEEIRSLHQENRSDGLGVIAITQRPARMDKTCLSQADTMFIGRVSSLADKQALKHYLTQLDDVRVIENLKKGEFFYISESTPQQLTIRKAKTEHSGNSPNTILTGYDTIYTQHKKKLVSSSGKEQMAEGTDVVKNVVPAPKKIWQLGFIGVQFTGGLALSRVVGNMTARMIPSPIPVVSSRTIGSAISVIGLYAGYKFAANRNIPVARDVLFYAAAGGSAYMLGSVAYDIIIATNAPVPTGVTKLLSAATGVSPVSVEAENNNEADLNTAFA